MNTLKIWLEKYGSVPEEVCWPSEHYLISSGGLTLAVHQYKGVLAMWVSWSSNESSICSLPGAVVHGVHALFITAAVFWWRICLGVVKQSWHRRTGTYLQGQCEAWGDGWRSQWHGTVRTGTPYRNSHPTTNSWWHRALNGQSQCQSKQRVLTHHDGWHRSWQPKKGQVKWRNCGRSVAEVWQCLRSCHPHSGVQWGTGLGTQRLAWLGS